MGGKPDQERPQDREEHGRVIEIIAGSFGGRSRYIYLRIHSIKRFFYEIRSVSTLISVTTDINVQEAAEIFGGLGMGKPPKVPVTESMAASTSGRGASAATSKSTLPAQSQQAISTHTLELMRKNIVTLSEEDLEGVPFDPVSVALGSLEFHIYIYIYIFRLYGQALQLLFQD